MPSTWIEKRRRTSGPRYCVRWEQSANGRRHVGSMSFTLKAQADEFKAKKEAELYAAKGGLQTGKPWMTWAQFAGDYLEYSRTHKAKRTFDGFDKPAVESFTAVAGELPLAAVGPELVERWKMCLLKTLAPNTVRMRLRALKAAFSHAARLELVTRNPAARIRPPAATEVARVLTADELARLVAAAPGKVGRVVVFAHHTGLRLGELLSLDWRSVTRLGEHLEVTVRRSSEIGARDGFQVKTRKSRVVPIHPAAEAAMGPPRQQGKVFDSVSRDVLESQLARACIAARVGRVRWHDLKHTFCTRYMERYGDIYGLSQITGNSLGSLQCYLHLARVRPETVLRLDFGYVPHYSHTKADLVKPYGPRSPSVERCVSG